MNPIIIEALSAALSQAKAKRRDAATPNRVWSVNHEPPGGNHERRLNPKAAQPAGRTARETTFMAAPYAKANPGPVWRVLPPATLCAPNSP